MNEKAWKEQRAINENVLEILGSIAKDTFKNNQLKFNDNIVNFQNSQLKINDSYEKFKDNQLKINNNFLKTNDSLLETNRWALISRIVMLVWLVFLTLMVVL